MSGKTGKAWLDVTQTRLRRLFDFDADAGLLIWRVRPVEDFAKLSDWKSWNTRFAGVVAGFVTGEGYRLISIHGTQWAAHRLIWVYVNGSIPDGMEIDHIDGVRDDNRLSNLRLVTHAENGRNQARPRNNTSGVSGVNWNKWSQKWRSQIKIGGQKRHLGYFTTREAAIAARAKAALDYGFHPGHGKVPSRLRSSAPVGKEQAKEGGE